MRQTKYFSNYGHCTFYSPRNVNGEGLLDNVTELVKTVASNDLVKSAVSNAGQAVVKSIGRKVGSVIGDKIADSVMRKKVSDNLNEAKVREQVLDDLKLLPDDYTRLVKQYGDGNKRKRKVRGAGLKILT